MEEYLELVDRFIKQSEENLEMISSIRSLLDECKNEDELLIINALQYFSIALCDLVMFMQLTQDASDWKSRLAARHFYLTIYEIIDDMREMLGKRFRDAVIRADDSGAASNAFDEVRKQLKFIEKKYNNRLREVRINIAAHRDHDAEKQIKYIKSISSDEVKALQSDLMLWCSLFMKSRNLMIRLLVRSA